MGGPADPGGTIPAAPRPSRGRRRVPPGEAVRSTLIALVSTVVVLGLIVVVVTNAPNWPAVQQQFFNGEIFAQSLPKIVRAFVINIQLFVLAELLVLVVGLMLAILRGLPGPVFFRSGCSPRSTSTSSGPCPGC
jgi:polar amino acid transport system permease protein